MLNRRQLITFTLRGVAGLMAAIMEVLTMSFFRVGVGLLILVGNPTSAQPSSAPEVFVDVSEEAGIEAAHRSTWDEFGNNVFTQGYLGIGQAWGDYDNDGWADLYVIGGLSPSTLYRNNQDGTFSISEYAADVSLPDVWSGGAVWRRLRQRWFQGPVRCRPRPKCPLSQ